MASNNLIRLLQLTDPTLPIGGFSHSYGLETYVQKGIVQDAASAKEFITQMMVNNIRYNDAAYVSLAVDAIVQNDFEKAMKLDGECHAAKLTREIRTASQKTGMRLLKIFTPVISCAYLNEYLKRIQLNNAFGHYSIAFGMVAATLEIEKDAALTGFIYNAVTSMVTNCVKLVPLGQQQGQEILYSLHPIVQELAKECLTPHPELVGLCCPAFDIRSMQHEQLYSRLYMS